MNSIFRLEMFPARQGDSLWIEYGARVNPCHILIDGGAEGTQKGIISKIKSLPEEYCHIELLIITHVDADHIEGILKVLEDPDLKVTFGDIWFNGWRHLPGSGIEEFGPVQGEKLTDILCNRNLPWNESFSRKSAMVAADGDLPSISLDGGMTLIILSPTLSALKKLRPVWESKCREAGLDPNYQSKEPPKVLPGYEIMGSPNIERLAESPFVEDDSETNGSSIAFIAEFEGHRILFGADAHSNILLDGIHKFVKEHGERLSLDAFKIPHHGSMANVSRELLDSIDCQNYLFSTNGACYSHPDKEAVARVIKWGGRNAKLIFNYKTKQNRIWNNNAMMKKYHFKTQYPEEGKDGIIIEFC